MKTRHTHAHDNLFNDTFLVSRLERKTNKFVLVKLGLQRDNMYFTVHFARHYDNAYKTKYIHTLNLSVYSEGIFFKYCIMGEI